MAGWLFFTVSQVVITSLALGALKRTGAIEVDPSKIKNHTLRSFFATAVDLGEDIVGRGEKIWGELSKASPHFLSALEKFGGSPSCEALT
ncbi:hypothetical protein WJX75_009055 [Coccomyxa subellipsoidea]|uniref:Uncharacterized protein n=1 Tax=Coccomyxa subellipsoidea TaxID=248742 RepID=A0ABR2YU77_9CHLO